MINFNNIISDPIIQALGWTLIHSLWQGVIIAILLSFVLSLLWKKSANARYLSSISAMVILLVALTGTFAYQYQIRSEIGLDQANGYTTQIILFEEIVDEDENSTHYFWESAWVLELEERLQQNMPILVLCWLIGSFAFTLRFLGGYFYLYRLTHYQLTPLSQSWNKKIKALSEQMGLRKVVRVFESALVDEPLTLRHFKPIILIPAGLVSGLDPDQLEAIFMHEMAHIRRADYLINLIQSLVEIVLFYHPAVWWISGRIRQAREESCDDQVMQSGRDVLIYAEALTTIQSFYRSPKPLLTMTAIGKKGQFTARIQRLFGHNKTQNTGGKSLLSILVLMVCLSTLAFQHPASVNTQPEPIEITTTEVPFENPVSSFTPQPNNPIINPTLISNKEGEKDIDFLVSARTSEKELKKIQSDLAKKDVKFTFTYVYDELGKRIGISGNISLPNGSSGSFSTKREDAVYRISSKFEDGAYQWVSLKGINSSKSEPTRDVEVKAENSFTFETAPEEIAEEEVEVVSEEANSFTFEKELPEEEIIGIEHNNTFEKERKIEGPIIESIGKGENVKIRANGASDDLQPLFIIDGKVVKSDKKSIMQEINPNDIESINVLKGESAIKAYGQEGENGVIEIITKFDKRPKSEREKKIELKIKDKKKAEKAEKYKLEKQLKEKEKGNLEQELLKKEKLKQEKIKYQKLHGNKESKPVFGKEEVGEMGDNPLFIINGKNIGRIEGNPAITVKKMIGAGKLNKSEIQTINFVGQDQAKKLYGGKAEDGAVVITTKSGNTVGSSLSKNEFSSTVNVFPNPFNDQLNINFFLSESSEVEISIHDMAGREIDRIHKNFGRGDQKYSWSMKKLPSGVYTIRVTKGKETLVKKVTKE